MLVELNKNQAEANIATNTPKSIQPIFKPKDDISDYLAYKNFLRDFEYYIINVRKNVDKLTWLLKSVKGTAYELIKNLSLESANYEVALAKLEKIYLNNEKIHLQESQAR